MSGKQIFNSVLKKASKVYDQGRDLASSTARQLEQKFNDFQLDDNDNNHEGTRTHSNSSGISVDVPKSVEINGERYRVLKLLDEGGFSYVFIVRNSAGEEFALKKLLIQEEEAYRNAMREIKFMKLLTGHENIVSIIGDKVLQSGGGKREVYILMELADDSLINVIQRKAEARSHLKEELILNIFLSVCKAVAHMHCQDPPILHRDLKIENVLIKNGKYKLCDFGSATTKMYNLANKQEKFAAEEDIQKNTTMAYRSPEMADLYCGKIISEKSDVWALGCVLYKMCYFVGPFEDAGNLQIINGKYTIPDSPRYSNKITSLLRSIFVINPDARPTVFDVIDQVSQHLNIQNNVSAPKVKPKIPPKPTRPITQQSPPVNNNQNRTSQPKAAGLFDMIDWYGGDSQPTATTTTTTTTHQQQQQHVHSNNTSGFEDDEWNADFSEFESHASAAPTFAPNHSFNQQPATKRDSITSLSSSKSRDSLGSVGGANSLHSSPAKNNVVSATSNQSNNLFSQLDWIDESTSVSNINTSPKPTNKNLRPQFHHRRSHSENVSPISPVNQSHVQPMDSFKRQKSPVRLESPPSHRVNSFDLDSLSISTIKSAPSSHVTTPVDPMLSHHLSGGDLLQMEVEQKKRIDVNQLFSGAYHQQQQQQQQQHYYGGANVGMGGNHGGFNAPQTSHMNYYVNQQNAPASSHLNRK
ncbi:serine/threonine-protein kinase [Acrasis kona]|uniref:non-specific serine/threonine protein kinase n=1 Tax=Acrasis kona TaxID=1008807 RepID=A0AAW2ZIB4_9EUKA